MFQPSYFSLSRQEQCTAMIELMKEYQSLKSSIHTIVENAETVAVIKLGLKDQEDTKRYLSKVMLEHFCPNVNSKLHVRKSDWFLSFISMKQLKWN